MDDDAHYTIPFVCSGETLERLRAVASSKNMGVAELIEQAVDYALENLEEEASG